MKKTGALIMTIRICGGHCPAENTNDSVTTNCRICANSYHLPCYDIIGSKAKLFVSRNIVFVCDGCLTEINSSPKRKNANNMQLKQSVLSTTVNGNVGFSSQQSTPSSNNKSTSKATTDKMYSLMASMKKSMEDQTKRLDEFGENLVGARNDIVKMHKKQDEVFTFVTSRSAFSGVAREIAHERFCPPTNQMNKPETPNANQFGSRRTYSSIVQSRLAVTSSETPRKREKSISLIHNATGQIVQTMKFPTPKQGKKDVEIGRPVVERLRTPRNVNPLSKAIFVSNFHPETTPDEVANYIVEHTDVKDQTKFKCTKLVKKDEDLTKRKSIAFKIDVTPEAYDTLSKEESWPKNKRIREFVKLAPPKKTLNDYMPQNRTESSVSTSHEVDPNSEYMMEVAQELANGGTSSNNRNNSSGSSLPKN